MTSKKPIAASIVILLALPLHLMVPAGNPQGERRPNSLKKGTTKDFYNFFDVNQIVRWLSNNGDGSFDPHTGVAGLYWPKGTTNTAVYEDGIVYGGFVHGGDVSKPELRLTGSTYRHGFQAGRIIGSGATARGDDTSRSTNRVFKIQKDFRRYKVADPDKYAQLRKDYLEWPGDEGAPYIDRDRNGVFDPPRLDSDDNLIGGDEPNFLGDQVLWHVSNDLDAGLTMFLYGSQPLGIEAQRLVWGYDVKGFLSNTFFEKWTLIDKGAYTVDSMFIGFWADVDLGGGAKDLVGCDTSLQLGYTWNGGDASAHGPYTVPPAVGYMLLQGPRVPGSPSDTAYFNLRRIGGYKNLRMSAFAYYVGGSAVLRDPTFDYHGSQQMYNYLNGLLWNGDKYIDPTTNLPTKYPLSGDPITNSGWIDGMLVLPADRRQLISTGPFRLAPGDTQEVIVACNVSQGSNKFESVSLLKDVSKTISQIEYRHFRLPPSSPVPKVTELPDKIILDWSDPVTSSEIENYALSGALWNYKFEGYNVYQLPTPSASKSEAVKIATFDVIDSVKTITNDVYDEAAGISLLQVSQTGHDSGIKRYFVVDHDYLTKGPLAKGKRYYFAVTAYDYCPVPFFGRKDLENDFNESSVVSAIPQDARPGTEYFGEPMTSYTMGRSDGTATADVTATLIDPTKATGSNYDVVFEQTGTTNIVYRSFGTGVPLDTLMNVPIVDRFSVIRVSTGDTVVKRNPVIGDTLYPWAISSAAPLADGIQWNISGLSQYQQYSEVRSITYTPLKNLNLGSLAMGGPSGALGKRDTWTGVIAASSWTGQFVSGADRQGLEGWKDTLTVEIRFADPKDTINKVGWSKGYGYLMLPSRTQPSTASELEAAHTDPFAHNRKSDHWWFFSNNSYNDDYHYTGYWDSPLQVWDVTDPTHPRQLSWAYTEQDSINGPITSKIFTNDMVIVGHRSDGLPILRPDTLSFFRDWRGNAAAPGQLDGDSMTVARYMNLFHVGDTLFYRSFAQNLDRNPPTKRMFQFQLLAYNFSRAGVLLPLNEPYAPTPNPLYVRPYRLGLLDALAQDAANMSNTSPWIASPGRMPALYAVMLGYKSVVKSAVTPGDVLRIIPNRPLTTASRYQFNASNIPKGAVSGNMSLAKQQVSRINVFPNPYFGESFAETNKYERFVTFTHLPRKATIRIFTLAGTLVRTINKDDDSQFVRWDLANESNLYVGSGMYLVHIDLGSLGVKVLKVAIIMGVQFLDRI